MFNIATKKNEVFLVILQIKAMGDHWWWLVSGTVVMVKGIRR
jgi:hypothetical protein